MTMIPRMVIAGEQAVYPEFNVLDADERPPYPRRHPG